MRRLVVALLALACSYGVAEAQPVVSGGWRPPVGCSTGQVLTFNGTIWACGASSSFSTNNVIPKGNGTGLTSSSLTDDGTTFAVGSRLASTATVPLLVTQTGTAALRVAKSTSTAEMRLAGGSNEILQVGNVANVTTVAIGPSALSGTAELSMTSSTASLSLAGAERLEMASGSTRYTGLGNFSSTSPISQLDIFDGNAGQTTAALTDAGSRSGMLLVGDGGSATNTGGALCFGNSTSHTANVVGWACIKGLVQNGAGNTTGDIAISTRNATGDTALTERMRIAASGVTTIKTGTSTAAAATSGTVLSLDQADATFAYLTIRGTDKKGVQFANASSATDGGLIYDATRGMQFVTATTGRLYIDSSGVIHIGNTTNTAITGSLALEVGGNETVSGTLSVDGNTTIGNASTKTLTVNATVQRGLRNHLADTYYEWNDDWLTTLAQSGSGGTSTALVGTGADYLSVVTGTSTTSATTAGINLQNHPGVVRFDTGSVTNANLYRQTGTSLLFSNGGIHTYEALVKFPVLSASGNGYGAVVGFFKTPTSINVSDGCYFLDDERNTVTSGPNAGNAQKLSCWCTSTGSLGTKKYLMDGTVVSDGGFTTVNAPIVADTWLRLKVVVTGTSQAEFYVNNVKSCNITTNIPGTPVNDFFGAGWMLLKSSGSTAVQMDVDYTGLSMQLGAAR